MAIRYYDRFSTGGRRNFGDDINPLLLGKLFHPNLVQGSKHCLIGIGTILNDETTAAVAHFERKIVFTSGIGYGTLKNPFDDSWDFVCVRGPGTARALGLPVTRGICDGAVLLADFYPPKPSTARQGTVFIPHVYSCWNSGQGLQKICRDLGLIYLCPDAPFENFIETVQSAARVITEAMHGAILADAMRTPWVPVGFTEHNHFKWQDWFDSIEKPFASHPVHPVFWDQTGPSMIGRIKWPYVQIKLGMAKKSLRTIMNEASPVLSSNSVLEARKQALRERVAYINATYGD